MGSRNSSKFIFASDVLYIRGGGDIGQCDFCVKTVSLFSSRSFYQHTLFSWGFSFPLLLSRYFWDIYTGVDVELFGIEINRFTLAVVCSGIWDMPFKPEIRDKMFGTGPWKMMTTCSGPVISRTDWGGCW